MGHRRHAFGIQIAVVAVGLAVLAGAAFGSGLGKNPANHRSLLTKPIEGYDYDRGTHCTEKIPKGTRALVKWLSRHTSGSFIGITRCERFSRGNYSLHSEGRAIDWAMDARKKSKRRQAMKLIRERLLATDRRGNDNALARRMGVQGIIFNCRSWFSSSGGLGRYDYCFKSSGKRRKHIDPTAAHIDHIHIELNDAGARKRTSFWRSRLSRR